MCADSLRNGSWFQNSYSLTPANNRNLNSSLKTSCLWKTGPETRALNNWIVFNHSNRLRPVQNYFLSADRFGFDFMTLELITFSQIWLHFQFTCISFPFFLSVFLSFVFMWFHHIDYHWIRLSRKLDFLSSLALGETAPNSIEFRWTLLWLI